MSIANLTLTKVAGGSQPQALQGSGNGVFAGLGNGLGGIGFFDAFLTSLAADADPNAAGKDTGGKQPLAPQTTAPAPAKGENPLALLQIALSKAVDANGAITLSESADAPTLKDQLDTTTLLINHLKNALPETGDQADLINKIIEKLQAKSDTLQADITLLETGAITMDTPIEDVPMPVLVALGLDPAQISDVTAKLDQLKEKLGRDITVEDLIAGVGGVLPPAPHVTIAAKSSMDKTVTFTPLDNAEVPQTAVPVGKETDIDAEITMDDLAKKLNALTVGGKETGTGEALPMDTSAAAPLRDDEKKPSPGLPEAGETADLTGTAEKPKAAVDAVAAPKQPHMAAKEQTAAQAMAQAGDLSLTAGQSSSETFDSVLKSYGLGVTSTQSYSSTAQSANVIATSASAGQAHPAAAMVASVLVKNAKSGNAQTMTIRLDPPELGNVSVRLQFGKDKSIKAHITVEKSDTYTMLQRDAQSIERALQSTGLDAKADSISFELAQDNGTFARRQNDEASGDKNTGKSPVSSLSGETGTEIEMINTSVAWQVDPSTGRVRYNLFA